MKLALDLNDAKLWLTLFLAGVSAVFGYGVLYNRVDNIQTNVAEQKLSQQAITEQLHKIQVKLEVISAKIPVNSDQAAITRQKKETIQ